MRPTRPYGPGDGRVTAPGHAMKTRRVRQVEYCSGAQCPTGVGLIPFRTFDEAVVGATSTSGRYDEHCAAARSIAERHFDAARVLERFAKETGFLPSDRWQR